MALHRVPVPVPVLVLVLALVPVLVLALALALVLGLVLTCDRCRSAVGGSDPARRPHPLDLRHRRTSWAASVAVLRQLSDDGTCRAPPRVSWRRLPPQHASSASPAVATAALVWRQALAARVGRVAGLLPAATVLVVFARSLHAPLRGRRRHRYRCCRHHRVIVATRQVGAVVLGAGAHHRVRWQLCDAVARKKVRRSWDHTAKGDAWQTNIHMRPKCSLVTHTHTPPHIL